MIINKNMTSKKENFPSKFSKKKKNILIKFMFPLFATIFFASIANANSCNLERPVCPFETSEGRILVNFGDKKIVSHQSEEDAKSESVNINIPSGSYKVSIFSYDGYEGRETAVPQFKESWVAVLNNDGNEIIRSSPIDDLEDYVQSATKNQVVNEDLTIDEDIDSVFALNVGYPDESNPNSVYPVCAAFDLIESEEEPPVNTAPVITLLGDNPITINVGDDFVDPGSTANDSEDGDITENIVVGGDVVDTEVIGTYVVTYNVNDSQGISADEVIRSVIVNESSDDGGGSSSSASSENSSSSSSSIDDGGGVGGNNDDSVSVGGGSGFISFGGTQVRLPLFSSSSSSSSEPVSVLGESSVAQCSYLKDYLKFGENNDPAEVLKLQGFLIAFEGLNIQLTGVFDQATFDAVSNFQEKYKEEILAPWGYSNPTGYVYITTKNKINEIFCGKELPFSDEQKIEIGKVKIFIEEFGAGGGSEGSGSQGVGGDVGSADGEGVLAQETEDTSNLTAGVGFIKSPMSFILDNKLTVALIGMAITLLVYMSSFRGSKV